MMPSKALDESRTLLVLSDVLDERRRQHALRGTQSLPWGVRGADALALRKVLALCRRRQDEGADAWPWVIVEEALEAALEPSAEKRRAELVQLAAVAVQAAEALPVKEWPRALVAAAAAMVGPPIDPVPYYRALLDAARSEGAACDATGTADATGGPPHV